MAYQVGNQYLSGYGYPFMGQVAQFAPQTNSYAFTMPVYCGQAASLIGRDVAPLLRREIVFPQYPDPVTGLSLSHIDMLNPMSMVHRVHDIWHLARIGDTPVPAGPHLLRSFGGVMGSVAWGMNTVNAYQKADFAKKIGDDETLKESRLFMGRGVINVIKEIINIVDNFLDALSNHIKTSPKVFEALGRASTVFNAMETLFGLRVVINNQMKLIHLRSELKLCTTEEEKRALIAEQLNLTAAEEPTQEQLENLKKLAGKEIDGKFKDLGLTQLSRAPGGADPLLMSSIAGTEFSKHLEETARQMHDQLQQDKKIASLSAIVGPGIAKDIANGIIDVQAVENALENNFTTLLAKATLFLLGLVGLGLTFATGLPVLFLPLFFAAIALGWLYHDQRGWRETIASGSATKYDNWFLEFSSWGKIISAIVATAFLAPVTVPVLLITVMMTAIGVGCNKYAQMGIVESLAQKEKEAKLNKEGEELYYRNLHAQLKLYGYT